MSQLEDLKTPITPQEFYRGLAKAWLKYFNSRPTHGALLVLMAQSALETGRWKSLHNYNFGNVKSVDGDGRDYSFFACNEYMTPEMAKKYVDASTPEKPAMLRGTPKGDKVQIWFYPDHPGCRFRAYRELKADGSIDHEASLAEGLHDYLHILATRFAAAWPFVSKGDPEGFVRALKKQKYFTDDVEHYVASVTSLCREFGRLDLSLSFLPALTGMEKQEVKSVLMSSFEATRRESLGDSESLMCEEDPNQV